jgi:hypothetical protein
VTASHALAMGRAAWWAARATRRARSVDLAAPIPPQLPPVPDVPLAALRGVSGSLRIARATCLTRAIVLQAWLLAHGDSRDLVIGVTRPDERFGAHAWLDGDKACHDAGFHELARRPPR